ncbi:uncharacterized protein K460DRAFT_406342 [Cucurbitaria berberidis CBS 394.84]|uniref:Uncharacterized protein n=1 Tax=Cucurbitaria berberidis CBS 394.84 TaxID=1168544 RepID=A0A9P4GIN7_9PLEO|nr:uncharacterized protein K460DRAFT_406342 [Cucurbitaria berberidis CBS 394.84]KAF1846121.1 hypothetical protein K460DRAFT_406342 [Cucurbitaria berberidis CBS 394.84]
MRLSLYPLTDSYYTTKALSFTTLSSFSRSFLSFPKRVESAVTAKNMWKAVLEILRPEKKKERKANELDASREKEEKGLHYQRSWTTMSSSTNTWRDVGNEAEGDVAGLDRYCDQHIETARKEDIKEEAEKNEVEDITALPPMPPPPIAAEPVKPKKERRKLVRKKASGIVQ